MKTDHPSITVIGCGYVGLTLAAVLANTGYTVYAVEVNQDRLKAIRSGRSFFFEAGADALIGAAIQSGKLIPTDSYTPAIASSSIIFSCVGTPDNPDGSSNLSYVFDVVHATLPLMKQGTIFVQKSTVPVGTGAKIMRIFSEASQQIRYVSCPEFSREGTAIVDTLWFDRVVTGATDRAAAEVILDLHRSIEHARDTITNIAGLTPARSTPESQYMVVGLSSAELIKVTSNAFLALKISFANSIAKLADRTNANISEVMDGVGADRRIGHAFLNAGRGYGGGCFPKDVSGLIRAAEEYGTEMEIMQAATQVNESMPHYLIRKARLAIGDTTENNTLHGLPVSVLGLSFKAGTSDVRRSPAVTIANTLARQGATVTVYDPAAAQEAKPLLDTDIVVADSLEAAVKQAVCVFIATDWEEFRALRPAQLSTARVLVDCMNCLDPEAITAGGITYVGVGR